MLSKSIVALALVEEVAAFSAPLMRSRTVQMFEEGDIGVLPPLGVYDPLGLIEKRDMRRYEIMEIKHGRGEQPSAPEHALRCAATTGGPCRLAARAPHAPRVRSSLLTLVPDGARALPRAAAMLGFLHVIHIESGVRFPGFLSGSAELKFTDMPAGLIASLEAVPKFGWLQIMAVACACETGYAGRDWSVVSQAPDRAVGDIGGEGWVRYEDPEIKSYKLNVERQNGRAAMMGITGCLLHELLGVDALYPTGGWDGAAPDPLIDGATSFANFPSFV